MRGALCGSCGKDRLSIWLMIGALPDLFGSDDTIPRPHSYARQSKWFDFCQRKQPRYAD